MRGYVEVAGSNERQPVTSPFSPEADRQYPRQRGIRGNQLESAEAPSGPREERLDLYSAGFHHVSVPLAATQQTSQAQQAEQTPIIKAVVVDVSGCHRVSRGLCGDW